MQITAEEKLMYEVMKAIYDSGIPIDFKGSLVLKAFLMEAGYHDEIRHTVDIDANWYSENPPTAEQMTDSLQKSIERNGIDLEVSLYRMYGEGRSAGFELSDRSTGEVLFTMDIDVNRPVAPTKIYEIAQISFRGVSVDQMLADKISAVSGDKVFRRIKDVVDLYYLSKVFPFNRTDIMQRLESNGRTLGAFHGFLHRKSELSHAYEKFRFTGDVSKPNFDDVYSAVKSYIKDILPKERNRDLER